MKEIFPFHQHIKFKWKHRNFAKKFCSTVKLIPLCQGFDVHFGFKSRHLTPVIAAMCTSVNSKTFPFSKFCSFRTPTARLKPYKK